MQRLGAVPNVIADNQWHHTEIDLLDMLRKVRPDQDTYRVDGIWLTDAGWMGNAHGVQVLVRQLPVRAQRAQPAEGDSAPEGRDRHAGRFVDA